MKVSYRVVIVMLLIFTTINIVIDSTMIGCGFEKDLNYWYKSLDNESEKWGMECEGELIFFENF
jgi:hypothetical protein